MSKVARHCHQEKVKRIENAKVENKVVLEKARIHDRDR